MYTLREVVAYATMTGCGIGMIMFLIAAYTRIFNTRKNREIGMDQGAGWAIAYLARYDSKDLAATMAKEWGFKTLDSLKDIDEYDAEMIRPMITKP
jgi:hypothetical protein